MFLLQEVEALTLNSTVEGEFKAKYSFESWEKEVKKDLNDKLCL